MLPTTGPNGFFIGTVFIRDFESVAVAKVPILVSVVVVLEEQRMSMCSLEKMLRYNIYGTSEASGGKQRRDSAEIQTGMGCKLLVLSSDTTGS